MIERLQVRGFKSLLDVDVRLGPLTVFVGANGSGKTSVLEAIALFRDTLSGPILDYPSWVERLRCRQGTNPSISIEVELVYDDWANRLQLELLGDEGPRLTSGTKDDKQSFAITKTFAQRFAMFRLDASAMARPTYSEELEPRLAYDGENLAAVLDSLQGTHRERFDEIERRMQSLVPPLRRLRVPRAKRGNLVGHQVAFDFEHATDIRADDASEGTLLLLGLLTIIESNPSEQPMTIMLDDLDRALHPKAQRELVGYLHELIRTRPNLQILATTHSPYLVEHLEFEEVRAITQAPDGTSVIGSLTDHPQAAQWREEMSAGEFWSAVGESWVIDERPTT
ncbi:MAG: AAA family ATPase [Nannocystaceae bacterium]